MPEPGNKKHKIFFYKSLLWKFEKKTISASKMVDLLGVLVQERALLRWWCEFEHLLNHINWKLISSIHRHNCSKRINIRLRIFDFTSKLVFRLRRILLPSFAPLKPVFYWALLLRRIYSPSFAPLKPVFYRALLLRRILLPFLRSP